MYGERERSGPRRARVVVAAAPGDPRAVRLVDDLTALGWDVRLAETPDDAEAYGAGAIGVAVLRPRYWNAPPIAALVRSNPPYLIPVLAEPMALPRGPWAYEPIPMNSPSQVLEEVDQALSDGVRSLGMRRPSHPPPQRIVEADPFEMATARVGASSVPNRTAMRGVAIPAEEQKASGGQRVLSSIISLIVAAAVIYGAVRYGLPYIKAHMHTTTASTATAPQSYTAQLPGPKCDTGPATWEPISDTSLTGTCGSDGFTLRKSGNFSVAGEVFFDGVHNAPFPASYQAQVTATILSGDANAAVGLEVHRQTPRGGQTLSAAATGWLFTLNDTTGTPHQLALGFFHKPAKTFALDVRVVGAVLTLTINGATVDTITDTTFTTTSAIALVVEDPGATKAVTAKFAQFTFTPLSTPALSPTAAAATATATMRATPPYSAAKPGPGCDTGAGQWDPTTFGDPTTKVQCTANGLQVTQPAAATLIGQVHFYNRDGNFPMNYSVAVTMDLSNANGGKAGIFVRVGAVGMYRFYVYASGQWAIYKIPVNGQPMDFDSGQTMLSDVQHVQMLVTVKGSTLSLSLNGTQVSSKSDTTMPYTTTDFISLAVNALGATSVVTFSHFVFTPLP